MNISNTRFFVENSVDIFDQREMFRGRKLTFSTSMSVNYTVKMARPKLPSMTAGECLRKQAYQRDQPNFSTGFD